MTIYDDITRHDGFTITSHGRLNIVGDPSLLTDTGRRRVAVIGARASTAYGDRMAMDIVMNLAPSTVIVTGGAFGIDTVATRAALQSGRKPIIVLPCGLDHAYPRTNIELFRETVRQGGLVVSEFEAAATARRETFLQRNRTIVDISHGVVVVEAAWQEVRWSGSVYTAHRAWEAGKQVFAVPGPVTSVMSAGCHRLIKSGVASLVTEAADIENLLDATQGVRR